MSRPALMTAALSLALGFSTLAGAQNAATSSQTHATQSSQPAPLTHKQAIKPGDRNCLRDTGSLIHRKEGKCLPVNGRSYSGDELERTGAQDNAHALEMLDPSITVGH